MFGKELSLTHITVHQMLTIKLGMKKKSAQIYFQKPFAKLKDINRKGALIFFESIENDPHFLERVINCDEN